VAFLLTFAVALVAALTLSGNVMAEAGVQCAPTGMESVSTPRDHYQAGEVATISGDGYAIACDVKVDVERPDGVVESFTATTDVGGNFMLDYQVPPPPGVVGQYKVVVRGLEGAELASLTFEDAPAPQFDIAPAHVAATGTHVFSALVRNTANASSDTARCVRITTPASVTVTSATFVVASPSTTGPWNLTTGANFVELRTDTNLRTGVFGSSNNWVRFEITANATSTGSATWTSRMVTSNASCPSGGSTDQLAVRVGGTFTRDYTADFRDASNNVIAAPTALQGQSQQYRIRITRASGGDDLSYAAVALPTCLTSITSISTTNSAGPSAPDFVAQLTDNYFRFVTTGDKLAQNGQWTQVQFTATATCSLGSHAFRTASWKNTSPETSQDDIFKLLAGIGQPTLTVISPNVAPTVAADDATVTVNEGQTAANTGIWGDANPTDTVTLSASVGTVVTSGANVAGTWSWTYPTTDGPDQTQTVTITANDGTTSTNTTFQLDVNNSAPSATFNAPASVDEASNIGLSLTDPSDPSSADTAAGFEYRFSCDNGTTWTPWSASNAGVCSTTDDGIRNVKGELRDKDGDTSTYSASVTVENVAPSATFSAPAAVDEGSDIDISLTHVVDPSSADTHEYRFSCDGGTTWTAWSSSATHACPTNDNGSRTVNGQVRDDDGMSPEYVAPVTVNNVGPSATFSAPETVAEGSMISVSVTDPSDPSSADIAGGFHYRFSCDGGATWTDWAVRNEHSCPTDDNGTKVIKAGIRDKDAGASTYSTSVTVTNVAPSATFSAPAAVDEGSDIDISLTHVVDPSSADTHEYRFSCDDGNAWTAWGNSAHACPTTDNGTVVVKGQIRDDDDGASPIYEATVTVDNVAPSATFDAPDSVNEGSNINFSLSDVVDPGSADTHEYRFSCDGGATWMPYGNSASHSCATDDDGTKSVTGQVRDDDGDASPVYEANVAVDNVAPTATFNAPESVDEGSNINLSLTDAADPSPADSAAGFDYRFSCDAGATWTAWSASNTHACPTDDNGTNDVKGQIRDKDGGTSTYSASVTVDNVAPTAAFNAPDTVNEGSNINLSLTSPSDPSPSDTAAGFQYAFDCGDGSGYGAYSPSHSRSCATSDNGTRNVRGKIRDKDGGVTEYTAAVTINNVAPTLHTLTANSYAVPVGTTVTVSGSYSDPGSADMFTCVVAWDDGSVNTEINRPAGSTSCETGKSFMQQGVYSVSMYVNDDDGGTSNTLTIVLAVYDPSAGGFVTGGGWINSPAGSYAADPAASGRANFGFNSQYKKGATVPTGQTEFQLHFASFNFHSDAYEWLVVSGHKAQYKGTGKVNGVPGYGFLLTAYDGNLSGGGGVDKFRIKVWRLSDGAVVYDTKMGTSDDIDQANPLAIAGGSIVIHKSK
jgi:hypothetical protein